MRLGKMIHFNITSGNIDQDTINSNKEQIHYYPYQKKMADDAFVHPLAAGSFRLFSTCSFDITTTQCFHFLYIYEGIIDITCDGKTYTGKPGQLLFLSPCPKLKYHIKSGRCHFFQAGLLGTALYTYRSLLPCEIPYPQTFSGASCVSDCIGHLLGHIPGDARIDTIMFSKWINDILTELSVYSANTTKLREQIPDYMLEMKNLFDTEYQKPYSLEILEHHFEKSRYRLCREFSLYFGQSPIQYLNHRRMEAAKSLLLSTSLSVHEVGSAVGIDNTNHFINLFKKETGATPLVFKQEAPVIISELHYPFQPDVHPQ